MISERDAAALTGGGTTDLHSHPVLITSDDLRRMHELEKVVWPSTNYTVTQEDDVVFVDGTNPVTITLPTALGGKRLSISRVVGASNVTIAAAVGETVNGAASIVINTSFAPHRLKAVKGVGFYEV